MREIFLVVKGKMIQNIESNGGVEIPPHPLKIWKQELFRSFPILWGSGVNDKNGNRILGIFIHAANLTFFNTFARTTKKISATTIHPPSPRSNIVQLN